MDAKETITYLYEHGHIPQTEHFQTIYRELNKPVTKHPDVQRLIKQVAEYQIKNQELADKNVELQVELKKAHWAVALCLLKIADGKGVIGLIELPDGRVYSLPVEILAEAKQALKGETHDY